MGKIDGVRKHTYNLELDFRLIGKAEEEAPHLPYFPHFRLLLRRAESFFLPSPCPVYTSAISYMEGPRRITAAWGTKRWRRARGSRGPGLLSRAEWAQGLCWAHCNNHFCTCMQVRLLGPALQDSSGVGKKEPGPARQGAPRSPLLLQHN